MTPFVKMTALAAPIPGRNLDTDQIIPARFLKFDRSGGYGQFLFHDLRFTPEGQERPEFILNREPYRHAKVLVTEENFGCGSSREGAVYALCDHGVRGVIGPSFGDIFYNNALKNGLVPVRLPEDIVASLRETLMATPGAEVEIDLEARIVRLPDGSSHELEIDPFWRECIMKGLDEIELTWSYMEDIRRFEDAYLKDIPWINR
ncbi:3-isopropylmalate dehydratase small subunit [Alsobacter sp. SYSU M60028]|uniref:3-isopropylmalate dehydratase small subunit n=1 Tax=Alsobacter ponti TaxID=2962936 RepID=A0ABT1LD94_9HYPH|nr:3-isopropylmalate dehydratase small subunit [Alsobacter ponti]MCP8939464.1 3-isopropylmalate dehydratase small subunit [Alsobacter ponti]